MQYTFGHTAFMRYFSVPLTHPAGELELPQVAIPVKENKYCVNSASSSHCKVSKETKLQNICKYNLVSGAETV